MARSALIILIVAVVVGSLCEARIFCRRYQYFTTCGTACPPTCSNPKPDLCTEVCVRSCQCKDGFLRRDDGNCVSPKHC